MTRHPKTEHLTPYRASLFVLQQLRRADHQALFAGGCVRDKLLGHRPHDFDIATSARPQQVKALFKRTLMVGAQFGVAIVMVGPHQVEVATFRSDGDYPDGRRPSQVIYTDARHDAIRRDFTINGMFYDPQSRQVIDYVDGRRDLNHRIIRAIGNPQERFTEDHLRVLRAIRFAARLDFSIEPRTWQAVMDHAPHLQKISAERTTDELQKIITHPSRDLGLTLARRAGLLQVIFPELSASQIDQGLALIRRLPRRTDFSLTLAALCVLTPQLDLNALCRRLKLANETRKKIITLCQALPELLDALPLTTGRLKLWLARPHFSDLLTLSRHYLRHLRRSSGPIFALQRQIRQLGDQPITPPRLLNGNDLIALGCPPGVMVGRLDSALYLAQLENEVHTRDQALTWALTWLAQNTSSKE